jgi:DNA-binding NtrC family response regulator
MGGMEAMEQLRLMDPKVLAIVSSGYSNDPIMADHASFGFAAMVPKPYQVEELTRTVQQLLQQRAASRS